jgi:hypothetical protein
VQQLSSSIPKSSVLSHSFSVLSTLFICWTRTTRGHLSLIQQQSTNNTQQTHVMSKRNEGEARVTAAHVRRLVAAGVRPGDIAVITPYNAQVCLVIRR